MYTLLYRATFFLVFIYIIYLFIYFTERGPREPPLYMHVRHVPTSSMAKPGARLGQVGELLVTFLWETR